MQWWQQPFFQVALPIIVTFAIATWFQSKRIDDLRDSLNKRIDLLESSMGRRLDAMDARLARIEELLFDHDRRITKVEERTSPLRR
jgi:hypothetical protein